MFFIGNILRNLTSAFDFDLLKCLLIYESSTFLINENMENINFHTLFTITSQPWSLLK